MCPDARVDVSDRRTACLAILCQLLDVLREIWLDAGNGSSTDVDPDENTIIAIDTTRGMSRPPLN
jgi:hypothetical protein